MVDEIRSMKEIIDDYGYLKAGSNSGSSFGQLQTELLFHILDRLENMEQMLLYSVAPDDVGCRLDVYDDGLVKFVAPEGDADGADGS